MDSTVNQRADGLYLCRMHDDLCLWDSNVSKVAAGWATMNEYAALAVHKFNKKKTGPYEEDANDNDDEDEDEDGNVMAEDKFSQRVANDPKVYAKLKEQWESDPFAHENRYNQPEPEPEEFMTFKEYTWLRES
ncbi:hypothetical protein JR316_0010733 [Psilocybe cubensis]|uniref:Uncharacterized protein n=2 Tax=Psilocybe cubensis TaxID=181762 RepID=A0A8H7XVH8_PSICU|nr:hypothetical protein JR316_0010733 [Psilocybe cubensis]KAH9476818.1 hypothetical protein JR316_0010733 [Psilocybe cubensis]